MADPEKIKDSKELSSSINDIDDVPKIKWLGGYFDIRGTCALTATGPLIQILNSSPKVSMLAYSLFKRSGIETTISERSRPSKSSKKKRWDVFINSPKEVIKASRLLKEVVIGKREQLEILEGGVYPVENIKRMKYLNSTNNILIADNNKLFLELGFKQTEHCQADREHSTLSQTDFCDADWLAGVLDAIGIFKIDVMNLRTKDMYKCTPMISIEHHNKKVIEAVYSTLRNLKTGCHIRFFVSEVKNRGKWTVTVSGFKRVKFLAHLLLDHLFIKREELNLINLYIHRRLSEPKGSIDELGYSTKCALDEMDKTL